MEFADLDSLLDFAVSLDSLMLVHAGLALWMDRPAALKICLEKLRTGGRVGRSHWIALTRLEGLAAAHRGNLGEAERLLRTAAEDPANELPLYRGHLWADHADVAARLGHRSAASFRQAALDLYRRLGAAPYVSRLEAVRDGTIDGTAPATGFRPDLTRESRTSSPWWSPSRATPRSPATGSSPRAPSASTHSKLYAKFAVATRHELTALVRQQPDLLTTLSAAG